MFFNMKIFDLINSNKLRIKSEADLLHNSVIIALLNADTVARGELDAIIGTYNSPQFVCYLRKILSRIYKLPPKQTIITIYDRATMRSCNYTLHPKIKMRLTRLEMGWGA